MSIRRAGKPTKIKKVVYLIAATVLGGLLSVIAHGLVEIGYLNWAAGRGAVVEFYGGGALWPWLQFAIMAAGVAGGFLLGQMWWRIIYVERKWERKTDNN